MNFVCIVFELGDKMLTLSSMENLIVKCNLNVEICALLTFTVHILRRLYSPEKKSVQIESKHPIDF